MHEFAEHVAAANVPKEHDLVPDTVYPELHAGWHVDPLARELVQSPTAPFVGAADASHGLGTHPVKGPHPWGIRTHMYGGDHGDGTVVASTAFCVLFQREHGSI